MRMRIAAVLCSIAIAGCGSSAPETESVQADGATQLEAQLSQQKPAERVSTIGALEKFGNKEIVEKVMPKYTNDPDPQVSAAAHQAMKAHGLE